MEQQFLKLAIFCIFAIASFPEESSGNELCRIGEKLCGRTCYDPKALTCFHNATIGYANLCRVNESICASSRYSVTCYDPKIEQCFPPPQNSSSTESVVCNKGQKACHTQQGRTCYNPDAQICLDVDSVGSYSYWKYSALCLKGQKLCDTTCYFPESRQCLHSTDY